MSQENVEFVRRAYEQSNPSQAHELFHPDAVWDMSTFAGWPEEQTYRGAEGILRFHRRWVETFDRWEFEVLDVLDAGERVVGIIRQRGTGKGSGAAVDMTVGQVWTVRDGKFSHMQMYADPTDALVAVGLPVVGALRRSATGS
jgi:ketosteroid isomerase-like protein